jgi:hypothetical protein
MSLMKGRHIMAKVKNIFGIRYGRLIPQEIVGKTNSGNSIWRCKCDCGNFANVATGDLGTEKNKKGTFSCGCLKSENARNSVHAKFWKHGHGNSNAKRNGGSKTHNAWCSMRARCNRPEDPAYKYYGARGIKVCERWNDFRNFLDDMGEAPKGLTLDRINNDGNYEPGNCRWVTKQGQLENRRPQSEWFYPPGPKPGTVICSPETRKKHSVSTKKAWDEGRMKR